MKNIIKKIKKELKKIKILNFTVQLIKLLTQKNPQIPNDELKIFNLLKDEINIVFDIGSREDLSFYKIKNDCKYYLFEPNKKAIKSLKKQLLDIENHHIIVNEFGLSDENKDDCVYYENSQSFIVNPVLKVGISLGNKYSLRTLDTYVEKNNIDKIDFLKIDTEGLDYKVLKGGINTVINKTSYIQFEYWDGVQKFADLLENNFDMYLMMEPLLLSAIKNLQQSTTDAQKNIDYNRSLIKLNKDIIDLIDNKLVPIEYGGNILCINKKLNKNIDKLIFKIC